jgi:hypothetical protein
MGCPHHNFIISRYSWGPHELFQLEAQPRRCGLERKVSLEVPYLALFINSKAWRVAHPPKHVWLFQVELAVFSLCHCISTLGFFDLPIRLRVRNGGKIKFDAQTFTLTLNSFDVKFVPLLVMMLCGTPKRKMMDLMKFTTAVES